MTTHQIVDGNILLHIEIDQTIELPIYRAWYVWDNLISVKLSWIDDEVVLCEEVNKRYCSQEIHHKWINWNWYLNHLTPCDPSTFENAKKLAIKRYPDRIEKYKRIDENYKQEFLTN